MELLGNLGSELWAVLGTIARAIPYLVGYVLLVLATLLIWTATKRLLRPRHDYTSLKTVTFGDESAVSSSGVASVVSVVLIFVL